MTEHDKALVERLKRFSARPIEHDAPAMNRVAMDEAAERIEAQAVEIERVRAEAEAHYDRGYYNGFTHLLLQHEALREALVDLLHAVCGEKGFAQAVRRDSGRIYPWPALELAEAKALAALGQSK